MREITDERVPHEIPFEAFGAALRVCASSPEILARIEPSLPPGWRRQEAFPAQHRLGILHEPEGTYSVFSGPTRISEGHGLELSLITLESQIRSYVALNSLDMTFVHAGAVAHEGRAMIFPGHSFAGKSTLVAALVRAGAIYYSDEFAVLDADGLVHPYTKPLSLSEGPLLTQADHPVSQLNGVAGVDPLPLGVVVVTRYRPGAAWNPRRLSPGEAALALLSNAVSVRARPDFTMRAVRRALEDAVTLEGERGEAAALADLLLQAAHA